MLVIALKIVAALVFEIWWIVSDDMRVCNFLIISNTSLPSKERHNCNGKNKNTNTCKNEYKSVHSTKTQLFYLIELICDLFNYEIHRAHVHYRKTTVLQQKSGVEL